MHSLWNRQLRLYQLVQSVDSQFVHLCLQSFHNGDSIGSETSDSDSSGNIGVCLGRSIQSRINSTTLLLCTNSDRLNVIGEIFFIISDSSKYLFQCFFHQLKDDGSWLDIGMSISQFIVSMCISLALLLLLSLSSSLLSMDLFRQPSRRCHSKEIESVCPQSSSGEESA